MYRDADLQEEKNRIQTALGSVKDASRIDRVLNFSLSVRLHQSFTKYSNKFSKIQDEVRTQDTVFVVGSVASTKEGRESAWRFFKQNADIFRKRYKSGYTSQVLIKVSFCS